MMIYIRQLKASIWPLLILPNILSLFEAVVLLSATNMAHDRDANAHGTETP